MADFLYDKEVTPWEDPGVAPEAGQRKWEAGEEPPAAWWNWFWDACQKCFVNIKDFFNKQTIDDTILPMIGEKTLMEHVNGIANRIKVITGEESYLTNPVATISWLKNAVDSFEPLGIPKPYFGTELPTRYLWCDGKTIGDQFSNANALASVDAHELFITLWGAPGLAIYESNGNSCTRGTSAEADWNAHKKLALPKLNGRTLIGCDTIGGKSANVVKDNNAKIIGGIGGEEYHTLTINEMPSHSHSLPSNGHYTSAERLGNGSGSNTQKTSATGGGKPHNNMQPWIAANWILRY